MSFAQLVASASSESQRRSSHAPLASSRVGPQVQVRALVAPPAFSTSFTAAQAQARAANRAVAAGRAVPSELAAAVAAASASPARPASSAAMEDDFLEETKSAGAASAAAAAAASSSADVMDLTDLPASPLKVKSEPGVLGGKSRAPVRRSLPPLPPAAVSFSAATAASASSSSSSAPTLQCMLCGASLAMLALEERQRHINRCLDQLSNPSVAAAASTPAVPARAASAAAAAPPPSAVSVTPQKRKLDSSSAAPDSDPTPAAAASASAASSSPAALPFSPPLKHARSERERADVCVIDDDDDDQAMAAGSASSAAAAAAANGGVRRSITDFFNLRGGAKRSSAATAATPAASARKSPPVPAAVASNAASPPVLQRSRTTPLPASPSPPAASASPSASTAASASSAAPTGSTAVDPAASFSAATAAAIAEADAAAHRASMLIAERTKDTWKFLLTGRQTGSIAPASSAAGKGKGATSGSAVKPKRGVVELDDHGMPLTSMPQGNLAGETVSRYGGVRGGGLPAHKRLPGTSVLTDAFMFTRIIQSMSWAADDPPRFFLSHFHADHYAGLSAKWNAGVIFCSEITARLVRNAFGAQLSIVVLPLHERIELTHGVRVTLIDAHHCPGAVVFVYETMPFAKAIGVNYSFLPLAQQQQKREEERKIKEEMEDAAASAAAACVAAAAGAPAAAPTSPAESVAASRRLGKSHGKVYVHGGDMRYHAGMRELFLPDEPPAPCPVWSHAISAAPSPHLPASYVPCAYPSAAFKSQLRHLAELSIHAVYLDTTYCNPRYRFPPQSISVAHTLSVVGECLARESKAGVSSLVEQKSSSAGPAKAKLDFFKPYAGTAPASATAFLGASSSPAAASSSSSSSATASEVAPSGATDEGISAFFTQLDSSASSAAPAAAATAAAPASEESQPICLDDDEAEGGGSDHEHDEDNEDDAAAAADDAKNANDEGDDELEDLMMRDFDRRDDDDDEENAGGASATHSQAEDEGDADGSTVPASSSNGVSTSLSSLFSSAASAVSSSLSSLRSLSSSFLPGYRQQHSSRTLFLVGSYSIGKEKIFLEIARQFGLKIWVPPYRVKTIKMLDLFEEGEPATEAGEGAAAAAASSSSAAAAAACSSSAVHASPSKVSTSFSAPAAPSASSRIRREWSEWSADSVLTSDPRGARLHVIPLSHVSHKNLHLHLDPSANPRMPSDWISQFHRVVAFRPTGWVGNKPTHTERNLVVTLEAPTKLVPDPAQPALTAKGKKAKRRMISVPTGAPPRKHTLSVSIHGVPYSEHSTYPELEQFVETLSAAGLREIIPTVNVGALREMIRKQWGHLINK